MPGSELKAAARRLMSENAPKLFFISIVLILISTVMSELQFRLPGLVGAYSRLLEQLSDGERLRPGLLASNLKPPGAALAVVLWLLRPVIEVGYKGCCLKISRGQPGDYKDLLDGFMFFGKIMLIAVVTSVLISLWSLLLVFPGIAAHYRYSQAYYILLDDPEKGALECIRESKRLMNGRKLDLFLLDLSFLGWVILDYAFVILVPLPFQLPLISIYLTPYFNLARALYYNQLMSEILI